MKQALALEIEETSTALINSFNSIPKEKVNKIPFESSWTASQLVQHVILSMSGFEKLISGQEAEANRAFDQSVSDMKAMLESPEKMKSPPAIEPEMREYDQAKQLDNLAGLKTALVSAVLKYDLTKLATAYEFPGGYLTKYEAAFFMLHHTQRHIKQLQNIASYESAAK